jgi:hypothetical protein
MNFKVGDKIRQKIACSGNEVGEIYEVTDRGGAVGVNYPLQAGSCHCQKYWELVGGENETFRVGDRVRCIGESSGEEVNDNSSYAGAGWEKGLEFVISSIDYCGDRYSKKGSVYFGGKYGYGVWGSFLELATTTKVEPSYFTRYYPAIPYQVFEELVEKTKITSPEKIREKKNIMSNIVNFAKNLVLSDEEKLLRKHGLKDECGSYTSDARELVMEKLLKDNETYLVEVATKKEAEEKK